MNIAVLSGKGGTGKTFISTNLARVLGTCTYIDCDVEEPNGHLFLKSEVYLEENVSVEIPEINLDKCDFCRICIDFCKFNALVGINEKVLVLDKMCHSCGGCMLLCPSQAINSNNRVIGKILKGSYKSIKTLTGVLNVGEASGVPIISKLLSRGQDLGGDIIIDSPPGSGCNVIESIKDADYCILVTEPTEFGLHNLKLVYKLVKFYKKPLGIIVNKDFCQFSPIDKFALKNNIRILEKIPYSQDLINKNTEGLLVVEESLDYKILFENIIGEVKSEKTINS